MFIGLLSSLPLYPIIALSSGDSHLRSLQAFEQQYQKTTEKRFICPKCNKGYERRNTLTRHLQYECGVSPQFHCTYCDFKAKHKSNLKSHVVMRHIKKMQNHGKWNELRRACAFLYLFLSFFFFFEEYFIILLLLFILLESNL